MGAQQPAFVVAAAAREGGIAQFLDLGSGLPSHPAVHQAVREVNPPPGAYVDFDQVAVLHSQALLAKRRRARGVPGG